MHAQLQEIIERSIVHFFQFYKTTVIVLQEGY